MSHYHGVGVRTRVLQGTCAILLLPLLAIGCSKPARPAILTQLDAVRQTPAISEAAALAPQGNAQAEQLREAAEREWQDGRTASAQIAAERALAAYDRTRTLARIVRGERDLADAQNQLVESKKALSELEVRQKQVATEQTDLELQLKVERDAEQLASPTPSSPAREAARREVARALGTQGRLLCAAARLLSAPAGPIDAKFKELDALDAQLAKERVPTPIDVAIRLRAECLHELVEIRRPKIAANPQGTAGDELFVKLSSAELTPTRDERGIAVTLKEAFSGNGLTPESRAALTRLQPILKEHATVPVLVIVHSAKSNTARDQVRGREATKVIEQLGASKVEFSVAGDRLPLLDRSAPGAVKRNERLEVVFVIPAT